MSLPPANSSRVVLKLRSITSKIYTVAFQSFPVLQRIIDTLSSESQLNSSNTTIKDDIAWAKESLNNDSEQLLKIQQHIQFLNAEETITNKKEILGVFNELMDFLDMILLDDLITTLKGINSTLKPSDKDYEVLKINKSSLPEIIDYLSRFKISFRLVSKPLRDVEFGKYEFEEGFLTVDEANEIEQKVDSRIGDLNNRLEDLKSLFKH